MKKLDEMVEKLEEALYGQISNGIEQIDTEEFGKVADIYKDLMSAKKNCYKAKYYESVVDAMEEASEEDGEEDGRKYYTRRSRDSRGRFTSRRGYRDPMMADMDMDSEDFERLRDMDRKGYNRMYFTEPVMPGTVVPPMAYTEMPRYYTENGRGGMRDGREGKSGMSRKGYVESKEMHNSGSEADKIVNRKELEKWIDDIGQDVKELVPTMSAEERTSLKTKMTNLVNAL